MSIIEQVSRIPGGAAHIAGWLGSGGRICDKEEAQKRANICLGCEENKEGLAVTKEAALATKKVLELKSGLNLRVEGEKSLYHCGVCTCVLRLLIWQPIDMVKSEIADDERERYPSHCWKLDK